MLRDLSFPLTHGSPKQMKNPTHDETLALFDQHVIANYGRLPVVFVRGEGSYLWDDQGRRYVDLMPGWGTTLVGHCHPKVVTALQHQAGTLIHVDNTFYSIPQGQLAQKLAVHGFGGKSFFCNSGAEANEGAIKLARLNDPTGKRFKVITMRDSFHGRTLTTITATGQAKYHKGYLPLMPGFDYVPLNDLDALATAVDDETCAVMLEPVQGEGGVNVATKDYMEAVRTLCDEQGVLLILDEVQTGMGRTGTWFGYQHFDAEPDIMTLAKALGGGVAIGAMCARPEVAAHLAPGTHASTFGGNALACAAAVATFDVIEGENLLEVGSRMSEYIFGRLRDFVQKYDIATGTRGIGMMIGLELSVPGGPVFDYCLEHGVRINCVHDTVIRLLPALNVPRDAVDAGLAVLDDALAHVQENAK
jgi:acetylornithine/N-succinyldiaminopimelate aminotransferase